MTNDAKLILNCLFDTIWRLFTSWDIPGTNITPAEFILFLAFAGVSLRFLFRMLGITPDVSLIHINRPNSSESLGSESSAVPRLNASNWHWGENQGWRHRDPY